MFLSLNLFEALIVCVIMWRERKYTLPELYYQAQNSDSNFLKFQLFEKRLLIGFILILSFSIGGVGAYEIYVRFHAQFAQYSDSFVEQLTQVYAITWHLKVIEQWYKSFFLVLLVAVFLFYFWYASKNHKLAYRERRC